MWSVAAGVFVSTHSRLKAAGGGFLILHITDYGFNTQPPEGGWLPPFVRCFLTMSFNTQPPEGGWNG